ncbi:MAG: hypoxanthine-guanine phosphoribosyltransferase [Acidiferrobacterales bacterium]
MKKINAQSSLQILREAECLYSITDVEAAINEMAQVITTEFADDDPIAVCVLNGGVVLFGKLLPLLGFPLETDYVHATRYVDNVPGQELDWIAGPNYSPNGRTILLIEDILDEGTTLEGIARYYHNAGAKRVVTIVLVVKDRDRPTDIKVDIEGLRVPDRYVFGYGMDYKGYLRNAPGIFAEKE